MKRSLDFITMVPGLHWWYSADTIMETINGLLASEYGKRFDTPPQPQPTYSRYVRTPRPVAMLAACASITCAANGCGRG